MGAGGSAREVARRTGVAAQVLQRKADNAARMSEAFSAGAEGEEAVALTLGLLSSYGWRDLPDRPLPNGGNLDELMVGPAGIAVIDAKNWSYPVIVKGATIYTGRFSRGRALDGLLAQVEIVERAISSLAFPVKVRGFLALTGEPDRTNVNEVVRDVRIVGLDHLASSLLRAKVSLSSEQIDEVFEVLNLEFPAVTETANSTSSAEPTDPARVHKLFDQNVRFFYIRQWNRSGRSRLYIKSSTGCDLGWKNINTGEIELTNVSADAELIRAVLASASPVGVTLAIQDLPKVPLKVPGGKLLSHFAPLRAMVIIGQEWSARGVRRLYGTLVDPGAGTFALGHADLRTGVLHPAVNGSLSKHLSPAVNYLQLLLERLPTDSRK